MNVCSRVSLSHIEDLRYFRVVKEVLFLVVFLELRRIVVPALLCRVCAGMGMLLGLQSERRGEEEEEGGEHEKDAGRGKGDAKQNAKWEKCGKRCREETRGGGTTWG